MSQYGPEFFRKYADLLNEQISSTSENFATEAANDTQVVLVDPNTGEEKLIGTASDLEGAKKLIKNSFYDLRDTGDRLKKVGPMTYALEPDYDNTGDLATPDNYKHMYHWVIKKAVV